jgi:hypothetical protein
MKAPVLQSSFIGVYCRYSIVCRSRRPVTEDKEMSREISMV